MSCIPTDDRIDMGILRVQLTHNQDSKNGEGGEERSRPPPPAGPPRPPRRWRPGLSQPRRTVSLSNQPCSLVHEIRRHHCSSTIYHRISESFGLEENCKS